MTGLKTTRGHEADGRVAALVDVARIQPAGKKRLAAGRLYPVLFLVALFTLLLLTLVCGVRTYNAVAGAQADNGDTREGLVLIANTVRANDATGSVAVGRGPEGRSLVIIENLPSGSYEVRTYLYRGAIVQEYALAGSQYTPESSTAIVSSDSFDFAYADGLLAITTDQGTCEVALRNFQGGE